MLLVHPSTRPDRRSARAGTERDVYRALVARGHEVAVVGLRHDLDLLNRELERFRPDVVFNLLEEFQDEGVFDFHAVTMLEARRVHFTGCNPRGLIVSRNKFWTTRIAEALDVPTPRTVLVQGSRQPRGLTYPAFVKFNKEHASLGITLANRVGSQKQTHTALKRMRNRLPGEAVVQEFIAGEDVSVSVLGNRRPLAFPPRRLGMRNAQGFATERVKFSASHRRKLGITTSAYNGPFAKQMRAAACRMFPALDLSGYVRFDFRVNEKGFFLIDVNANPNLAMDEDLARSARAAGLDYPQLIERLIHLATRYEPRI